MRNTHFDTRSSEFAGDLTVWLRENGEDNADQVDRLKRNLRRARASELTPRQRQMLQLYFDEGKNMACIARELQVARSTVSRTIARAKTRLHRCLRYGL